MSNIIVSYTKNNAKVQEKTEYAVAKSSNSPGRPIGMADPYNGNGAYSMVRERRYEAPQQL